MYIFYILEETKMKLRKVLAIVLAMALCIGMVSVFASCNGGKKNYAENNTEFVIGLSGPLTGGAAVYGQAVKNSAQMAVDEINAAGGLNGVMFKLVATDDQHDPSLVSANYYSMYEGGMQVSLGTVTTDPGLEYKELSQEDNVFFLTPSASGDDITKDYDNGYQMCFADGNQGAAAAKYVNDNYAGQTIGAFYKADDAYSKGIYDQFMDNLNDNVTVVSTNFTKTNETNFATQIDTLKNCKFIFMPTYYGPASLFMTQAKSIIAPDAIYYGCDGFDGIDKIDGFDIKAIPQAVTMLSHFNSNSTSEAVTSYVEKYTTKYGTDTLNQFGASAYDCVYAIYYAMKSAMDKGTAIDVTISASDLCDILKAEFQGGFTFNGKDQKGAVTGTNIKWNADGTVNKAADFYEIKPAN